MNLLLYILLSLMIIKIYFNCIELDEVMITRQCQGVLIEGLSDMQIELRLLCLSTNHVIHLTAAY